MIQIPMAQIFDGESVDINTLVQDISAMLIPVLP